MSIKRALAFLLIVALAGQVGALRAAPAPQDPIAGTIKGTLVDASGQPLSGYKVRLVSSNGTAFDSAPTGVDGRFEVAGLAAGSYTYQILDPDGKLVTVRIPPVNLEAGVAVTQPIAIVPRKGSKGPMIAWIAGGAAVAAALLIAANSGGDDDDDNDNSMTPGGGTGGN